MVHELFSVNVMEGEPNDRPMTTGQHTVRDIYCCKCGATLGWKYASHCPCQNWFLTGFLLQDKAFEPSQKYKEGKYILERNLLVDVH